MRTFFNRRGLVTRGIRAVSAALVMAVAIMAVPRALMASNALDTITGQLEGKTPAYMSFTGRVVEISEYHGDPRRNFVTVEDENEAIMNFIATANTYYADGAVLEVGMTVTGYYDAFRPMLMIYPPQPEAAAFRVEPDDGIPFAKADRFDANMVSYDGILKLNIPEDAVFAVPGENNGGEGTVIELVRADGSAFTPGEGQTYAEALTGKGLLVFYDVTTRSIPAQTTPKRIVVLDDEVVLSLADRLDGMDNGAAAETALPEAGTPVNLVVAGGIVAELPLTLSDGVIMVPIYLVCDALGIGLEWDGENRVVTVDNTYAVHIGVDSHNDANSGLTIAFGAAPVIIDDRAYVPLQFFTQVLGLNNAYFFEGQIVIDNFEKME